MTCVTNITAKLGKTTKEEVNETIQASELHQILSVWQEVDKMLKKKKNVDNVIRFRVNV